MNRWLLLIAVFLAWMSPAAAQVSPEEKACRLDRLECSRACLRDHNQPSSQRQECQNNCGQIARQCVAALRSNQMPTGQNSQAANPGRTRARYITDPWRYVLRGNGIVISRYVMSNEEEPRDLSLTQSRLDPGVAVISEEPTKILSCIYGEGNDKRRLGFWHAKQPTLPDQNTSDKSDKKIASSMTSYLITHRIVDMVATECPGTWGSALETGFGPQVWEQLAAGRERARKELAGGSRN